MQPPLAELQKAIGYTFKNEELLIGALTHSSYANENLSSGESNERLEFLGDSVLGFIAAEYFYKDRTRLPEGELTKLRAAAVCEKSLFSYSQKINLGSYLFLGKGEIITGGDSRPSILADAFEALLAAIYLDGGMGAAKAFALPFLKTSALKSDTLRDHKTTLQEVIQKNPEETLDYVVVAESGPDHNKVFTVEVHLNNNVIGKGKGKSKKIAEQEAAKEALALMGL